MNKHMLIMMVLGALTFSSVDAQQKSDTTNYVRTPQGFFMVLQQGDNLVEYLEKLMISEKIPSATISGMGFVNVKFGFYKHKRKKFKDQHFKNMELTSMSGSMAWENNRPSIHVHGTVAGKNFKAFGGHILGATVSTGSAEINIVVINNQLERKTDPILGVPVLKLE